MMIPWFGVVVNGIAEPDAIAFYEPRGLGPAEDLVPR
jgi:hypothetical protein